MKGSGASGFAQAGGFVTTGPSADSAGYQLSHPENGREQSTGTSPGSEKGYEEGGSGPGKRPQSQRPRQPSAAPLCLVSPALPGSPFHPGHLGPYPASSRSKLGRLMPRALRAASWA